eukprot:Hpha_TRINITY_DN19591_c0_g1::TRINITY_DN19591_c0_g1_i1::g.33561::m.33561
MEAVKDDDDGASDDIGSNGEPFGTKKKKKRFDPDIIGMASANAGSTLAEALGWKYNLILEEPFVPRFNQQQLVEFAQVSTSGFTTEESVESYVARLGKEAHERRQNRLTYVPGKEEGQNAAWQAAISSSNDALRGLAIISSAQAPRAWLRPPLVITRFLLQPAKDGRTALHAATEAYVISGRWRRMEQAESEDSEVSSDASASEDSNPGFGVDVDGVDTRMPIPPTSELLNMLPKDLKGLTHKLGISRAEAPLLNSRGGYIEWLERFRRRRRLGRFRVKEEREARKTFEELLAGVRE